MANTMNFPKTLLYLIIVALAFFLLSPLLKTALANLPLTNHAKIAHQGETWNATTIQEHMKKRACTPHEYMCADTDQEIAYCEIKPGLAIGLIAGRTVRQIITGFAGPTNFWESRCP